MLIKLTCPTALSFYKPWFSPGLRNPNVCKCDLINSSSLLSVISPGHSPTLLRWLKKVEKNTAQNIPGLSEPWLSVGAGCCFLHLMTSCRCSFSVRLMEGWSLRCSENINIYMRQRCILTVKSFNFAVAGSSNPFSLGRMVWIISP